MTQLSSDDANPGGAPVSGTRPRFRAVRKRRSDKSLMEGAVAGDRASIAEIWVRHSPSVRAAVTKALGDDPMLEDVVQDVFVAFIRGVHRIQDASALRSYLVSTAIRLVAQEVRCRKVRRLVGLSPTGQLPERPTMPVDSSGREFLQILEQALRRLSTRRRDAFVLREIHGFDVLQVAERLDISESTLRRELDAARAFLLRLGRHEPAFGELLACYQPSPFVGPGH